MANWLCLERLKSWEHHVLPFFQYDRISDFAIRRALDDLERLSKVDPTVDWEDDLWLSACQDIPDTEKHAYRVAAIVRDLQSGSELKNPISLDTFNFGRCGCGIGNGHHRLRALQFLGVRSAPFSLGGRMDALESLVRWAGAAPEPEFAHLFEAGLLSPEEFDITVGECTDGS